MYIIVTIHDDGSVGSDFTVYTKKARAEKIAQSMRETYKGNKASSAWKVEVIKAEIIDW